MIAPLAWNKCEHRTLFLIDETSVMLHAYSLGVATLSMVTNLRRLIFCYPSFESERGWVMLGWRGASKISVRFGLVCAV